MSHKVAAVLFGPKTVVGAARNLDELIRILQSELTTAGFSSKPEVDAAGNFFRVKAGFGASAKVYYRAVGDDIILTPEAKGSSWVWLLCCIGLCPGLIGLIIRDSNVKKVIRRLPTVLEATNSSYKARFPPSAPVPVPAPAYQPPLAPAPMKSICVECGQKMTITSEGVFFIGPGEPNVVKLRCERCDITRFEKKADIERELGRTLPREFTLTPQQYQLPEVPKPPEALPVEKYCVYCEAEMRVEAVYCPKCGRRQVEEEIKGTKEAEAIAKLQKPDTYFEDCFSLPYEEIHDDRRFGDVPEMLEVAKLGNAGKVDEALRLAESVLLGHPDLDNVYYWLGHLHNSKGMYEKAREALMDGMQKSKRKYSLYELLGDIEYEAGKLSEAVKWWARSVVSQISIKEKVGYGSFLYLAYVCEAMGLGVIALKLFNEVDTIRFGKIRLTPSAQMNIHRLVKTQGTESMRRVLEELYTRLI